jgi:hypothetical protein
VLGVILKNRKTEKFRMGLEITHYKATLQRPLIIEPFNVKQILEDEYEGFDVNINYFENFIQKIDKPEILETIIFTKRENEIEEVMKFLNCEDYHYLFENETSKISQRIEQFVRDRKLDGNLIHSWETDKWYGFHVYRHIKQIGFYFEEIGEQRKGMNENFWKRFVSNKTFCFTKKEDFDFALTCVDFYWQDDSNEDVELRRKLFEDNFVKKYELNRSWMSLSY